MKVAVVGSNSLLASYLVDTLLEDNVHHLHLFGKMPGVDNANTTFTYFAYPESVVDFSTLLLCDAIIYCAATGVQANKVTDTSLVYEVNALLPIKIINYLSDHCFSGIWVSFGSYFEIGNNDANHYFTEAEVTLSELAIPNHYCSSKRLLTRFLSSGLTTIKVFHFILPTIYGARENSSRLIPYIVESLKNEQPMQLSAGTQVRQYLHCLDVAALVRLVIQSDCLPGIYNVASEEAIQIRDLVKRIFSSFNKDAETSLGSLSTRDESMRFLAIDTQKLAEYIPEWKASVDLQQGINEYLQQSVLSKE
ncbi:NAD-dependent epimerase/dehydratase family protein [Hymenobacter arizonensis]|uniref:Nucleoside-diphosphate-sugar epimerase n=1 Tax=Hymenobacter arizonensis TaxID=1227077 RepID=A0A1I6A0M4_HYMAR|nr:NAD(P)-dependent oxidoreductase [Hymenobacter arizonensis]SFQ62256.1 Nucleoside-diphosphate-sugar epimerase [Hymenobacter arizonensis]